MFKQMSVAEFIVNGKKAYFFISDELSILEVQTILNRVMHYCVEKIKEVEVEEAQKIKDAEANKVPELEAEIAPKEGENDPKELEVVPIEAESAPKEEQTKE